jgi:hypothetical protein
MNRFSTANLKDVPDHPALPDAHTWSIVGLRYQRDPEGRDWGSLELTVRRSNEQKSLHFDRVVELQIDAGFPFSYQGLELLDVRGLGWEDVGVCVTGFEDDAPGIRFWAASVRAG